MWLAQNMIWISSVYKGQTIKDAGEFGEDYEINDNDTIDEATKQIGEITKHTQKT